MEHRHSKRVPANVRLRVYKRGEPVGAGRLMDVSKHGLFIETDFDEIGLNQKLEIEFGPSDQSETDQNRMSTVVVRKTSDGLGLELDEEDHTRGLPELYAWLRRRLRHEQLEGMGKKAGAESARIRRVSSH